MARLRMKELFKALFLAGFLGYLTVAVSGVVWFGLLALMAFGWLFYDFRGKVETARRILKKESYKDFGVSLETEWHNAKKAIWDKNRAKIFSFVVLLAFSLSPFYGLEGGPLWLRILFLLLYTAVGILMVLIFCSKTTDKQVGKFIAIRVPMFFFWKIPKFLLKTGILTVRAIHSKELVAVSVYSLSGMAYIIAFPPFALSPAQVFLLAIGCGLFTGCVGLAIHIVLLTTLAQRAFAKVETW